ncbi:MAG: S16 family serine protease [Candidatus Methanoperedens sp.]|nr:S16 family serine protease [Candidatus Methanoperedens sp.]
MGRIDMVNKFLCAVLLLLMAVSSVHALEDGVTIPLVAYRSTEDGDEGVLLSAKVIVTNGTGHVFVDTNPYTQVDLQGSARLAAMVASDVLGIDQKMYDFYYIIDISSPIIGGPSAGGALTVATIAAINKWTLKPDVVMTGMINPDESIGPVGGIPFKLEAAAAKNATLFLIPEGQSTVIVRKTVTRAKGALIISEEKEETVDVRDLGKKLNVEVKEVSTIQDAVLAFTNQEITRPAYKGTILTSEYLNLLEPLATNLKKESDAMYEEAASAVPKNQFLEKAKEILKMADKMYNDKKYYAATSSYFNAMFTMRFVQWDDGYSKASDKEQYLTELVNKVENQIKLSETSLESFKSYGISDVEAVGAAESRITTARAKLEEAKKLSDTDEKISSLAFAHERARTAQWWLTLALPGEKAVPENVLKDRAGWYLSQAQSINTYMQALLSESGAHPEIIGGANEDINRAQKQLERGYYAGAILDSLNATIKASAIIGLLGKADSAKKVEQSADAARAAINEARMAGIEPTLAVSTYEYAETMTSPYDRISQYSYAKMIAKTSVVLNSHAVPSNKTAVKPTITPFIPEITIPTPTATATAKKQKTKIEMPAFEAVAAIAVTLIVRRLNKK